MMMLWALFQTLLFVPTFAETGLIFQFSQHTKCPDVPRIQIKPGNFWQLQNYSVTVPPHQLQLCYHKASFISTLEYDITLISFTTSDRILSLTSIATKWQGPVSLAYYIKSPAEDLAMLERVLRSYPDVSKFTTIHLIWAQNPDEPFPINILRNVAQIAVSTSHSIHYDIDFLPSKDMRQQILKHNDYLANSLTAVKNVLLVIPAFEIHVNPNATIPDLREEQLFAESSPTEVKWKVRQKILFAFHDHCKHCQGATNHFRWANITTNHPFEVEGTPPIAYEPYVVAPTFIQNPVTGVKSPFLLWDEIFVGYGRDKTIYYSQLREHFGYTFVVLPDVALMHRQHEKSTDAAKWSQAYQNIIDRAAFYMERAEWWRSNVSRPTMNRINHHGTSDVGHRRLDFDRRLTLESLFGNATQTVKYSKSRRKPQVQVVPETSSSKCTSDKHTLVTFFANDEQAMKGRFLIKSYLELGDNMPLLVLLSWNVSSPITKELCRVKGLTVQRISHKPLNAVIDENEDAILLALWSLTQYTRIVFIGYQHIIQRSLELLFKVHISGYAAVEHDHYADIPKLGLFVIEPSLELHEKLWNSYSPAYDVAMFLAKRLPAWRRLPEAYNPISRQQTLPIVSSRKMLSVRFIMKLLDDSSSENYGRLVRSVAYHSFKDFTLPPAVTETRCSTRFDGSRICTKVTPNFCVDQVNCAATSIYRDNDISLVTFMAAEKIDRLFQIYNEWTGPMSAVITVVDRKELGTVLLRLLEFRHSLSRVAIHICQPMGDAKLTSSILRNVGVNYAATDMIFILDAEFSVMPHSYKLLTDVTHTYVGLDTKSKHAMVVPAFGYSKRIQCNMDGPAPCIPFPSDKQLLTKKFRRRIVERFQPAFPPSHWPTDYSKWLRISKPYYVRWKRYYEPCVIVRKSSPKFPRFEESFSDNDQDYAFFIFELHIRGFHFAVLPDVFVLHSFESAHASKKEARLYPPVSRKLATYSQNLEVSLRDGFECPPESHMCGDYAKTFKYRYQLAQ